MAVVQIRHNERQAPRYDPQAPSPGLEENTWSLLLLDGRSTTCIEPFMAAGWLTQITFHITLPHDTRHFQLHMLVAGLQCQEDNVLVFLGVRAAVSGGDISYAQQCGLMSEQNVVSEPSSMRSCIFGCVIPALCSLDLMLVTRFENMPWAAPWNNSQVCGVSVEIAHNP